MRYFDFGSRQGILSTLPGLAISRGLFYKQRKLTKAR
jgi:hypothetical protein